jgi:hypothetical protein
MTKTPKRDPNFPHKNLSAFQLYQNEMRHLFQARFPTYSNEELDLYAEAMFDRIPFMEKCVWVSRAEDDRMRYVYQLETYIPSPGYDVQGNLIVTPRASFSFDSEDPCTSPASSPRKANRKDPRYPKRALSAYMLFQNHMRRELKNKPDVSFSQIASIASDNFKALSEEERAVWVQKAQDDKIRFDKELKDYKPTDGYDYSGSLIKDDDDSNSGKKKKKKLQRDYNSPKRAAGAYVFFANEMRPKLQEENPGVKFVEIGRILGEKWRALTDEERAPYDKLSMEDKARYRREMKEYKERRQEKGIRGDETLKDSLRTESSDSSECHNRSGSFCSLDSAEEFFTTEFAI